jgi:CRISPR-associated protein Csb1
MTTRFDEVFNALKTAPRLLIQVDLRPVQGDRFQPTGFPDLGAAVYKRPDGTPMLLVESAQSMANRMEKICWDDAADRIVEPLKGLPHIVVKFDNGSQTSSIQEAHRLNSPYIINDAKLNADIVREVGNTESGALDIRKLAQVTLKRDANALLHGVFLEKVAGRLRLQRLLSSFIEAEGVRAVTSGGVKLDRVNPKGAEGASAKEGYGNVPFSRTEFVAAKITAYFNLDLATLRGYGLGEGANRMLVALALYKMLQVLESGLRLRTACDFDVASLTATRPAGIDLGTSRELLNEVTNALPGLIEAAGFGADAVTVISTKMLAKKAAKGTAPKDTADDVQGGDE